MQDLPPGHSPSGASVAALGGFLLRVRRDSDGRELLARSAGSDCTDDAGVLHLDAELEAFLGESRREILTPTKRIDGHRRSWLLYDVVAGEPLDTTKSYGLEEFWEIAEAAASALAEGHRRGRTHGRLESSCIWWDPAERRAALLGLIHAEHGHLVNQLPPTLDTAPELMVTDHPSVSPAADVYSLGAIFYRLLSGRPAVSSSGNLAFDAAANPPTKLDREHVPERLSALVTRMLSKCPASRPPDATAVLEELRAIKTGNTLDRPTIALGAHLLVGRSDELDTLLGYARQAEEGAAVVVRVEGEPGVGKTTLLAEFVRRMSLRTRLVGHAKFDQFRHGRPYGAVLDACGSALNGALSGDEFVFVNTRRRLHEAAPALLSVMAAEVAEVAHFCERLPDVPEVGPSENDQRYKRAFGELLGKLSSEETPLVLVLDDLQWADRATADLLAELVEAGLPQHLLLVLAYRDEAAKQNTHLVNLLQKLDGTRVITVGPFDASQTARLCQLLVPNCERADLLAGVVHRRSQGNALHCVEVLKNFVAGGELAHVGGRWSYLGGGGGLHAISETVAELIRDRLSQERPETQRTLMSAACIGHRFSEALLAIATGTDRRKLRDQLERAVHRGFLIALPQSDEYTFCHDRIRQIALLLEDEQARSAVHLRLGRHYRRELERDRSALFPCLDYLNQVSAALDDDERRSLSLLNLEGARRARRAIAYDRAIPLVRRYLESDDLSEDDRFDATLLLTECLFLKEASGTRAHDGSKLPESVEQALGECAALATTRARKLRFLHSHLLFCVHNQDYATGVDVGLRALRLLGYPLPARPSLPRVIASVALLSARMRRLDPDDLSRQPDSTTEDDRLVFSFLVGLWGPAHWTNELLKALVCVHLMRLTVRCGNGEHSSMGYISYAAICHIQHRHAWAIRYARVAERLAKQHGAYTRAVVRFLKLTFLGAFEAPPTEVIRGYDEALREAVAHGEMVASHLIDGAVTTFPHLGPEVPLVRAALGRYEREARTMCAKSSLEMIRFVRCWCELLCEENDEWEADSARATPLRAAVEHQSFAAGRDILCMQIEYLRERDDEVLRLGHAARNDMVLKGNPLHTASHALFTILAATRKERRLTGSARAALECLRRLDAVVVDGEESPANFRPSLLLAQGVSSAASDGPGAIALLEEAARLAKEKGQGLVRAISLERLARLYGEQGNYALCVKRIRDAALAYRRFGALAKANALVREFPGLDWTQLRPRGTREAAIQVESIMRAANAIVEATSTKELGSTLLRVIATAAGAMRAFLFVRADGALSLVAGCERDQANLFVTPTAVGELDPQRFAIKPIRRVERSLELVELPRDHAKFVDDPYLATQAVPRPLLCVPLLYRGELVAVLYLEGSSNAETFGEDEVTLVTLLGKQAAIAMTNADNYRLEIEALQSKVNPHFLYNALTVIAELVGRAPEDAEEAVYRLTRLYRYMVSSRAERVPLEKELAIVRDYLELERARFGDRLNVVWDVEASVGSLKVPALLLQPLAENAVNHGVRRNVEGGTVRLAARTEDDALLLSVSDNGPGWYEGQGGTGFGLRSVRRRLELVYGKHAKLTVIKNKGVTVELRIPI